MSDAHFILQSDSADHSYSQLCDSQWVAVDVYLCFHWSPANSGQACFSCTLHCEISSHIHVNKLSKINEWRDECYT